MKTRGLVLTCSLFFIWILYSGFFPNDNNPKWNQDPRTNINIHPEGNYIELPQGNNLNYTRETRYISTPQGVFAVGPNFRVHPRTAGTQSETPITVHPLNPKIMYASANTYQGGNFCTGWYVTTDGGVSWFGNDTMYTTVGTAQFNFGDPAPMIDYTGRLLISYITLTGSMGASYSVNNGANWSTTYTFPGATTNADKNLSATDFEPTSSYYGRSYTVYTEFGGAYVNRIVVSYTTNQGVSWSAIVPVSPPPSAGHHHQGCDVAVDPYGWVRVVWANCTTNGQNSTEDSLGWAESADGGVSWSDQSNHKVNMNGIRTSDLLTSSSSIIRANGFLRIDIDRSCNPTSDDAYVVTAEKNFAPALDNADIVLMKTPDGGSSWTRTRVNQNAAGSYEYFPAVNVDETGAINICYYSTRNTPANDSAEIYLSRSTDGGSTFTDIKISDHKFKPTPITGTASGYQGDYIGITSGGDGKILPYWCEGSTASGGRYQAWAAMVDITKSSICEDFSCTEFNPSQNFFVQYTGTTNYWSRETPTAYATGGSGSAKFSCYNAAAGTVQSIVSYEFPITGSNTYLTFDHAYAAYSPSFPGPDTLDIERSFDGGVSYFLVKRMIGRINQGGDLNTTPDSPTNFSPANNQWRPKIFILPSGTKKIRFKARSGFGNNIWIDNICVQTLSAPVANSIGLASQGMFIPANPYWRLEDTVRVYLHRSDFPNVVVDSAVNTMGSNAVSNALNFTKALDGNYYRVVKHRNSIETWSSVGVAYIRGSAGNYNFIQPDGQAYANNQVIVSTTPFYRGMYSGDIDQNGFIDLTDVSLVYNDAVIFASGYKKTDVTGDNITDLTDLLITYNNNADFVTVVKPPGAEPQLTPVTETNEKPIVFENDAQRQKYEFTKQQMEQSVIIETEKYTPNWSGNPPSENEKNKNIRNNIDNNSVRGDAGTK